MRQPGTAAPGAGKRRVGRPLASLWLPVHGRNMHARVATNSLPADRPTVVLVHGLGLSNRYMVPLAQALAASFHVYAPDLPGFGKSDPPDHVLDIPELADALAAWMDAAGIEQASLIGNSLGCEVIVDFAARFPERVEHAVLNGPPIDRTARSAWRQIARGCLDMLGEPLRFWPVLIGDYLRSGPVRDFVTLRYALRDPVEEKLPHVQAPTLVIRGEHDLIVPQRWAEEVVRLLPHGRLAVVRGAAHVVNYSRPDEVARLVVEFFSEALQPA